MAFQRPQPVFAQRVLLLALLTRLATASQVSIRSNVPDNAHDCVGGCLVQSYYNLGKAMACGSPLDNDCYCATASASVSVASAFIDKCVSTACAGGDASKDRSIMRSIYGAYCLGAGYTQPGISSWVPAVATTDSPSSTRAEASRPSETGGPNSVPTQTEETSGGGVATKSQPTGAATVTVFATSTPEPKDNSAVKIGVGVAVPVAALLAFGLGFWLWMRRRQRNYNAGPGHAQPPMQQNYYQQPPPPQQQPQDYQNYTQGAAGVVRKAVPAPTVSPVSQSKGVTGGDNRPQELNSQFAPPAPTSPVSRSTTIATQGQYTMAPVAGHGSEFPGQTQTQHQHPASELSSYPPGYDDGRGTPRWELAGNAR
ncbi:hypothetical protein PLIIFM63780_009152 [Purpureocillium lilacinum]|nr:hypothetical protein PLIIFM63780_009152 [Purpureocillium lilacinum]